jgi:hypothetical protein
MKIIIFMAGWLFTASSMAWGPGWGPGGYPGWGPGMWPGMYGGWNYGGGGYGMVGMGVIQTPSFNYTTTIVQSPPIIVNQQGETLYPNQNPGYNPYPGSRRYSDEDR